MKVPLIIDTDPGLDDAIAIMTILAAQDRFDLLGLTTVAGNQSLETVTSNALKIRHIVDGQFPIAPGASKPFVPLSKPRTSPFCRSRFDSLDLPESGRTLDTRSAVDFLKTSLAQSSSPATILALGPLTNIATLLRDAPESKGNIREISLMGGSLSRGNVTKFAEFNVFVDPEAADVVFRSGIPITMSGLDVTKKALIFPSEWEPLHRKGPASRFTAELLDDHLDTYGERFGFRECALHDVCAAMVLMNPELFQGKRSSVSIVLEQGPHRGRTIEPQELPGINPSRIFVLRDVQREAFVCRVIGLLETLDRSLLDSPFVFQ